MKTAIPAGGLGPSLAAGQRRDSAGDAFLAVDLREAGKGLGQLVREPAGSGCRRGRSRRLPAPLYHRPDRGPDHIDGRPARRAASPRRGRPARASRGGGSVQSAANWAARSVDIRLANRRFGAEHPDDAGLRQLRRRLDRGDRADDRHIERGARWSSAMVLAVLQAMTISRGSNRSASRASSAGTRLGHLRSLRLP